MENEKQFFTPREIAVSLGVCKETVLRWVRDERIPFKRIGKGKNSIIRIPAAWVSEYKRNEGAA